MSGRRLSARATTLCWLVVAHFLATAAPLPAPWATRWATPWSVTASASAGELASASASLDAAPTVGARVTPARSAAGAPPPPYVPPVVPPRPPVPPEPDEAPSLALFARADALDAERRVAAGELDTVLTASRPVETRHAETSDDVERLVALDDAARARVRTLAVNAYIEGGFVPGGVVESVLGADRSSIDQDAQLALIELVGDGLLGHRRDTLAALTDARAALASASADLDEATGRIERARTTLEQAEAAAVAARNEAEATRADEELARFAFGAWELDLRARTAPPQPYRSGVVPPAAVPADLGARLVGVIPRPSLEAYWRAASTSAATNPGCHLDWALLAAIGHAETGHGTHRGARPAPDGSVEPVILGPVLDGEGFERITDTDLGQFDGDPIMDRAVGPMQFIPSTWRGYSADGNGDGIGDPHNIYDAAVAAADYLCRNAGGDVQAPGPAGRAVLAYNHSSTYAAKVLGLAEHYRGVADPTRNLPPPAVDPDDEIPERETPPDGDGDGPSSTTTTTTTSGASSTTTTSSTAPGPSAVSR